MVIQMAQNLIEKAVSYAGGPKIVGTACGKSYQAVLKWIRMGRLPRTEWTGETNYAEVIERLTKGKYPREKLVPRTVSK
jgi:hypothetical protein